MAKSMRMEDIIDFVTGETDSEKEYCSGTDLDSEQESESDINYSSDENVPLTKFVDERVGPVVTADTDNTYT